MRIARTVGMVAASVIWGAGLLLAWPFIRRSIERAQSNLEHCG